MVINKRKLEENQQRVINDMKEIFGIKDECPDTNASPAKKQLICDKTSSYMEQQKAKYANAYEHWTKDDDERLVQLYSEGKSISELMLIFKRNEGSIKSRIKKLIEEIRK